MKLIIIILLVFMIGCKENDKEVVSLQINSKEKSIPMLKGETINLKDDFLEFSKKFEHKNLPLIVEFKSNNWVDFNSEIELKEINKSETIKYLLNGNKAMLLQSDGGVRQFYYAYKVNFPNKNIGLIYYRTDLEYIGLVMSLYSGNGDYLDELFLAGSKGEYDVEAQKDVVISEDGIITVSELKLLSNNTNSNLANYDVMKFDSMLKILNKETIKEVKIKIDQNSGRIIK